MLIDGFNEACNNITASSLKFGDESTSAISFRTTAKGNLNHLYYIFHKPEPLGIEFKTVTRSVTGVLLFIEVQIGKEGENIRKYHQKLGATENCTKRMKKSTKGIGHRHIKGATKDFLIFGSFLSSKNLEESEMDFGAELICMVKTNTKIFCKETIENLTKDWPGGAYIVLRNKPMAYGAGR